VIEPAADEPWVAAKSTSIRPEQRLDPSAFPCAASGVCWFAAGVDLALIVFDRAFPGIEGG
jgi:hypothetical protein